MVWEDVDWDPDGLDPEMREGVEYAEQLAREGVDVEHSHYEGAIHPFFNLDLPQADDAIAASAERVRTVTDG